MDKKRRDEMRGDATERGGGIDCTPARKGTIRKKRVQGLDLRISPKLNSPNSTFSGRWNAPLHPARLSLSARLLMSAA